jgi:hypothetical protein
MNAPFGFCACGAPRETASNSRCRKCQAAYMRDWRLQKSKSRGLAKLAAGTPSLAQVIQPQLTQVRAQDAARMAKYRGTLKCQPCVRCGDSETEMHHPDYSRPLDVIWLCRTCHAQWHARLRAMTALMFQHWIEDYPRKTGEAAA